MFFHGLQRLAILERSWKKKMIGMAGKILKETKKEGISFDGGNGKSSSHTKASLIAKGSTASKDKATQEFVVLDDCPACRGATFRCCSKYGVHNSWEEKHLSQCIQCGRIFRKDKDGKYEQWPRRSHNGKEKNFGNNFLYGN